MENAGAVSPGPRGPNKNKLEFDAKTTTLGWPNSELFCKHIRRFGRGRGSIGELDKLRPRKHHTATSKRPGEHCTDSSPRIPTGRPSWGDARTPETSASHRLATGHRPALHTLNQPNEDVGGGRIKAFPREKYRANVYTSQAHFAKFALSASPQETLSPFRGKHRE